MSTLSRSIDNIYGLHGIEYQRLSVEKVRRYNFTTNIMRSIVSNEEKVIGLFERDRHNSQLIPLKIATVEEWAVGVSILNTKHSHA